MGYVPDSHFRQLLKGLSKGLLELLLVNPPFFLKYFFQIFSSEKNAALFKASYTVQWYGIDAVLRPLIPWPRILVLTGFSGGGSIG